MGACVVRWCLYASVCGAAWLLDSIWMVVDEMKVERDRTEIEPDRVPGRRDSLRISLSPELSF